MRGQLPVPREIFPRREGNRKIKPAYIKNTAPLPKPENDYDAASPVNKTREWKKRMASTRRENLEESLKALWQRQKSDANVRARISTARFEANKAAMKAPEREDDRLTRSTILDSMLDTAVKPDPNRFSRARASRLKVEKISAAKREARRDALMELYINASSFIVEESELKAKIDEVFAEDYFRKEGQRTQRHNVTDNVWGVYGPSTSLSDMVKISTGTSQRLMDLTSEHDKSAKRMKRIAEEFTGGKMEVEDR